MIENEREGKYLGKTVQVVPHITNEIKRRIHLAAENCELLIGEIGGTVGDIESLPYLESIRQFAHDVGQENVIFIHLVLLPYIEAAGELKSKPAQHSVKELRSIGLFPQMIICRTDRPIEESVLEKISLFCNVPKNNVFESRDQNLIYKVPLHFHEQGLDQRITEILGIWSSAPDITSLKKVVYNAENPIEMVKIAVVGKYTDLVESYKSLNEALTHGAISEQVKLELDYVDAEKFESLSDAEIAKKLAGTQGILVPGGFGSRGTEGKIKAIKYARESKTPFFGICLGLQLATIEYARNVAGIKDAGSKEFTDEGSLVVHYMEGQSKDGAKGGSMRLGAYDCVVRNGSLAMQIYGSEKISERHRHRLEVNNLFVEKLEKAGLVISGKNPKHNLVELIELKNHPYFIACQFHPEFKSKPDRPHPLFANFVKFARANKRK